MVIRKLLVLILVGIATASAQQEDAVIRITVGLVQVDAVVTDKAGSAVTDLSADDFIILQDGEEQPITGFSFVETETIAPRRAPFQDREAPAREEVRRTIAIVADDLSMSLFSVNDLRKELRTWVDTGLGPGDLAALVRTSAGGGRLNSFTTDKRQLHRALDELFWRPGWSGALAGPGVSALGVAIRAGIPVTNVREVDAPDDYEARRSLAGSLGALQHTIRGMRALPGRKAVLFFSESAFLFQPSPTGRGPRPDDSRVRLYRMLVDEANRAGVVIYGVDPRGVAGGAELTDTGASWAVRRRGQRTGLGTTQDGMQFLARQTGGLFLDNSNNLGGLIEQAARDLRGYYLLGYAPHSETFDREFHRIEVRLKNKDLVIRSRRGFFGYEDKDRIVPKPETREEQLVSALESPFGSSEIGVRVTALFALTDEDEPSIQALARVDAGDLTFTEQEDGQYSAEVDLLAAAFDINGAAVGYSQQTFRTNVPAERLAEVRRNGMLVTMVHPLEERGAYQFRVAVRDAPSERLGAASQFIETPRLNKRKRLATSGIIAAGMTHLGGPDGSLDEAPPRSGPATRVFRPGERIYYWRQIMNAARTRRSGDTRLATGTRIYRAGELVHEDPAKEFVPTVVKSDTMVEDAQLYDLPGDLAPGRYVLEVETRDLVRAESKPKYASVTGWIDFRIEAEP